MICSKVICVFLFVNWCVMVSLGVRFVFLFKFIGIRICVYIVWV